MSKECAASKGYERKQQRERISIAEITNTTEDSFVQTRESPGREGTEEKRAYQNM